MSGTSENNVATAEMRHKWVTFHDEMDDVKEDHEIQERRKPEPQGSTTLASLSSDKYAAFSNFQIQGRSKGWSENVIGSQGGGGPMGWSDAILGKF